MKSIKFLSLAAMLMIFVSCSNDDDNSPPADELTISLGITGYKASFYQSGESGEVMVTSTIGDPTVDIAEGTDSSITYNAVTNRVEWTQLLPIGDNVVTIVATVDGTEATTDITIENEFEGTFSGGNNNDPLDTDNVDNSLVSVVFSSDNTLALTDDSGNDATGTWSLDGNTITLIITYDDVDYYTYQGDIVYNGAEAYVDGMWYNGQEAEVGMEQGYFRIDFLEI